MPVCRFSNQLVGAVTAEIKGRTPASRKGRFGGQVDVGARLRGRELGCYRRFGVDKKRPSPVVDNLGDLAVGALRQNSRAKDQRRWKKPCHDCRAFFHHRAMEKANINFGTHYSEHSFQQSRTAVNVPLVLRAPAERSTRGETVWRWLALRSRVSGDAELV